MSDFAPRVLIVERDADGNIVGVVLAEGDRTFRLGTLRQTQPQSAEEVDGFTKGAMPVEGSAHRWEAPASGARLGGGEDSARRA